MYIMLQTSYQPNSYGFHSFHNKKIKQILENRIKTTQRVINPYGHRTFPKKHFQEEIHN